GRAVVGHLPQQRPGGGVVGERGVIPAHRGRDPAGHEHGGAARRDTVGVVIAVGRAVVRAYPQLRSGGGGVGHRGPVVVVAGDVAARAVPLFWDDGERAGDEQLGPVGAHVHG